MIDTLFSSLEKPALYEKSAAPFWDDAHISKGMLEAHLNAGWDAASRKHRFIDRSVDWIASVAPPAEYPRLLDLGCGPGLYAERFAKAGYTVTGIDFSKRSIDYAKKQNETSLHKIDYLYQDYLTLDYCERFDVVTIIYCDYGALPPEDRKALCDNAFRALRPGGVFILDVFSMSHFENEQQGDFFDFCENGGFWSASPYLCLNSYLRFADESVLCRRHVVATEREVNRYIVYDQCFSESSLLSEIETSGFQKVGIYADVSGKPLSKKSDTICGVFKK